MKNTATNTTPLGDRLLSGALWELSLLGHKTFDVVKLLLQPGGWFRSLPHVRILLVLSMLVLIFDEDVSFSIGLGDSFKTEIDGAVEPNAANAGFFDVPKTMFSSVFTSSAISVSDASAPRAVRGSAAAGGTFVKTDLTVMDWQTASALIRRFQSTAADEQAKFGINAGVLLATAIAAGVVQSPEQVANTEFTTNYFGEALHGSYPSAWSSWRAMSLAIVATIDRTEPTIDDFVLAAAKQFDDVASAKARIYEALRYYQL